VKAKFPDTCCLKDCSAKPTRALQMLVWASLEAQPERTRENAIRLVLTLVCCEDHAELMVTEATPNGETKAQIDAALRLQRRAPADWSSLKLEALPIDEAVAWFRNLPATALRPAGVRH
jgi:hypothetical protein